METQTITPEDVAQIVAQLTPERRRTIYEFAQFLAMYSDTLIENELSRKLLAWKMASEQDTTLAEAKLQVGER